MRAWRRHLGGRILAIDLLAPRWAYVARVFLAATIALGFAYYLQLETPYSAATTVFLVAHPIQGITLSKGAWRVIGSILGATIAVLLIAFFAQAPGLFILGFAVWLGLCVGAATLLRHFRGYGAVVAGYTIGLVIYGTIDTPELIFDHAVGRVSVVTLGVVSLGLTTALLSRRDTRKKLKGRLAQLTAAVGRLTAVSLVSNRIADDDPHIAKRHALVGDIYGIDDLLEFSSAESADVALRADAVRHAMAALFAVLVGSARTDLLGAGASIGVARTATQAALDQAAQMLEAGGAGPAAARKAIEDLRQQISGLRGLAEGRLPIGSADGVSAQAAEASALAELVTFDRLDELLEEYETALTGLVRLHHALPRGSNIRFHFHLDRRGAIDNGVRATLAILFAGAFWIATAWTSAPLMILLIAPFCGLLALTPNPVLASVEFTKGIVVAVIAGFVCTFGLLPHVSGFPLLIVALAPFWIAGLYATTNSKTGPAGTAYLLTFMTMVGPTNPMLYDVAAYLNSSVAFILSGFCTLLSFRLFLPRNPARDATRIAAAIRDDTLDVLGRAPKIRRLAFEHLQHQRLARLGLLLKNNPARLTRLLSGGFAALHVGRAVVRIRETLVASDTPTILSFLGWHGLQDIHRHRSEPQTLVKVARHTADRLFNLDVAEPEAVKTAHRLAASFFDIATLFEAHVDFFLEPAEKN
jgi:uncharacterized membrane protein YccC